jgi:protein tyrosine phosphatase
MARFIAAQGPLPQTIAHFWKMIWHQRPKCIVMLVEVERRKCEQYWPHSPNQSIHVGELEITLLEEKWKSPAVIERKLSIRSPPFHSTFDLLHVQYAGWPDHALPLDEREFESVLQTSLPFRSNLLVHCSAGVGRTGTFITALCLLAKNKTFISFDELLDELKLTISHFRRQRIMIVQNSKQFHFLVRFLSNKFNL